MFQIRCVNKLYLVIFKSKNKDLVKKEITFCVWFLLLLCVFTGSGMTWGLLVYSQALYKLGRIIWIEVDRSILKFVLYVGIPGAVAFEIFFY